MACRDTGADGRNDPSEYPVVIFVEANHSISRKNCEPSGTSVTDAVAGGVNAGSPANRYKNAAIACRDTGADGRNDPSEYPVVIFVEANHSISRKNCEPSGTSVNAAVAGGVNAGSPANRYKHAASACRDTGADGRNDPSEYPVVIFVEANHSISRKNCQPSGTSVNDAVAGDGVVHRCSGGLAVLPRDRVVGLHKDHHGILGRVVPPVGAGVAAGHGRVPDALRPVVVALTSRWR